MADSGYEKLKADVEHDLKRNEGSRCQEKFEWVIARAKHYAEKTGLPWESILDAWEKRRSYWYMNYYQECNQPEIKGDNVKIFDSVEDMRKSMGEMKFRCPSCGGVSSNPYECNSGKEMSKGKVCDWKVYGLFGDLGKGVYVFCKDKVKGERIFMPLAWEMKEAPSEVKPHA